MRDINHFIDGASFVVGTASPAQQRLLDATREARDAAIAQLRAGELMRPLVHRRGAEQVLRAVSGVVVPICFAKRCLCRQIRP